MLFVPYFLSAGVTYALLSTLYAYEVGGAWRWKTAGFLCVIKGLHWGASMEMEAAVGALASAILCSLLFHGSSGLDAKHRSSMRWTCTQPANRFPVRGTGCGTDRGCPWRRSSTRICTWRSFRRWRPSPLLRCCSRCLM